VGHTTAVDQRDNPDGAKTQIMAFLQRGVNLPSTPLAPNPTVTISVYARVDFDGPRGGLALNYADARDPNTTQQVGGTPGTRTGWKVSVDENKLSDLEKAEIAW
jgi:hypothetical protein